MSSTRGVNVTQRNPVSGSRVLRGMFYDMTELQGTEGKLLERLRFETLLSEVSSRFVNVPADKVDDQIEEALGLICAFLAFDRGTLLQIIRDEAQLRVTHSWAAETLEPIPVPTVIMMEGFPWGSDKVFRGEMIMFSKLDDLPDERMTNTIIISRPDSPPDERMTVKQAFQRLGTKSHLTIPLSIGGSILGLVSFATLRSEHIWPEEVLQRLKFIGEIFANALSRKRYEEELAQHRRHLEQMVQERTRDLMNAKDRLEEEVIQRSHTEEELHELYEQEKALRQLIEAEMKRRVEFTRTLAHELKTPLTPVLASSESLLAEIHDERLLSLARNINRGAESLNNRIDELLDLARGEVGLIELNTETINPLELLHEAAESIDPVAMSKSLSLNLALPPSLPPVQADVSRLQQVLLNLLTNAVKFTPKGGKIKLKAFEKDAFITVEVQDNGPGISEDEQGKVFEPYHRMSSDKGRLGGLGLGLAICKRLVEMHGGQIWVKNHPGSGAAFGFSLPVYAAGQPAADSGKQHKLWKILIIEDDREIVDSISLAFEKDWPEAEILSTGMGEDGVDLVEAENPDIVILDLGLPDINGFEVLMQLRLFSSVPVIVLTVREAEDDVARALEWGADDYITKPFKKKELLARLKAQLRKQTSPDDETPTVYGSLRFDPATAQLKYGERDVSLTIIEGRIIRYLMKYPGQVVTHSRLAEAVWGEDYDGATVSLRSHIRRLRKKIELDPGNPRVILTKSGIGYSLARPV